MCRRDPTFFTKRREGLCSNLIGRALPREGGQEGDTVSTIRVGRAVERTIEG